MFKAVNHQSEEASNPPGELALLKRLGDGNLQMHHGSGDAQRRVALIPDTVHVLDWVTGQSVDKDTGGVGFSHALHLEGQG